MTSFSSSFPPFRSAIRRVRAAGYSVPLALAVLTLITYGLHAFSLGFFWDDFPFLWIYHAAGQSGIVTAFSADRPFLSFIYSVTLNLFGNSGAWWQLFALFARWLCGVGVWWLFSVTWPNARHKAFWVAALFTVYPGFTQQWIAIIYGQAFILYAALLFSLGITIWLARQVHSGRLTGITRRWVVPIGTLLAVALSAFAMFSTEYFFGLELLRPALLWIVLTSAPQSGMARRDWLRREGTRVLRWWLPYLILMLFFVLWRGVLHTFPDKPLSVLSKAEVSPFATALGLFLTIARDFFQATLAAWGQTLNVASLFAGDPAVWLRWFAPVAAVGLLAWGYLILLGRSYQPTATLALQDFENRHWAQQAIFLGVFGILVAGWPFWITGLPMFLGWPQDRYTLPLSLGVSLLVAGMLDGLGSTLARKAMALALLLGLAAGFQNQVANTYVQDWADARGLFWQLTWRAPSIAPNTLILSDALPLHYYEDDSLNAALNWTYDPHNAPDVIHYLWYDLPTRRTSFRPYQPGVAVLRADRGFTFTGSSSQALVIAYSPPGCLKILDPRFDADLPGLSNRLLQTMPLSHPEQWVQNMPTAARPPEEVFGVEPKHNWCYTFEKAELARQQGDWAQVFSLAKEAVKYPPSADPAEYLPFIEGFIHHNALADAAALSMRSYAASTNLRPALCSTWQRATEGMNLANSSAYQEAKQTMEGLHCDLR